MKKKKKDEPPKPRINPFTRPANQGYDDGFEGRFPVTLFDSIQDEEQYRRGYAMGERERGELKNDYTSNT